MHYFQAENHKNITKVTIKNSNIAVMLGFPYFVVPGEKFMLYNGANIC